MRAFLSGPWHRKQVSDMIGRMSRLKLTSGLATVLSIAVPMRMPKVVLNKLTLLSAETTDRGEIASTGTSAQKLSDNLPKLLVVAIHVF